MWMVSKSVVEAQPPSAVFHARRSSNKYHHANSFEWAAEGSPGRQ